MKCQEKTMGRIMKSRRNYEPGDSLTRKGAEEMLEKIQQYWKDKGKEVYLWIEDFVHKGTYSYPMFAIRSDLINGLPRD